MLPSHLKATTLSISEKRQTTLEDEDDFFLPATVVQMTRRDSTRQSRNESNPSVNVPTSMFEAANARETRAGFVDWSAEKQLDTEQENRLNKSRPGSFVLGHNSNDESRIKFDLNTGLVDKDEDTSKKIEVERHRNAKKKNASFSFI